MSRDTASGKKLRMITAISKASGVVIPVGDMKYSHYRFDTKTRVFKILTPVTGEFEEFEIPDKHYYAKVIPQAVLDLVDYYVEQKRLMERARDIHPMSGDLAPLCKEEVQVFGVREMQPNRCVPRKFYPSQSDIAEALNYAMVKLGRELGKDIY